MFRLCRSLVILCMENVNAGSQDSIVHTHIEIWSPLDELISVVGWICKVESPGLPESSPSLLPRVF